MSLPTYSQYKDSGVACLGKIPAHWEVLRLKQLIDTIESGVSVNAMDTPAGNDEPGVLKTSCVYGGEFDPSENKVVVPEERGRVACPVREGTLIVSRMNTPDLVGAAGVVRQSWANLFLPDRLWQVCFKEACPVFVHYWSHTPAYRVQVEIACAGTSSSMQNLSQDDFRSFTLALPTHVEQSAIVAFLDRETGKIDALIAEQEKLLTLLAEKREATISHAVTRGLNADALMKDSGVKWIGDVPSHWNVEPLAYRYSVQLGKMLDSSKISGEHLRPYLRVFDVQWGSINTEELPMMDFDDDARAKFRLVPGDILVNEGGSYPGRSAIWTGDLDECYYQKALHRLRPSCTERDTSQFFYYVMSWAANQGVFVAGGNETTIEHLPAEKLRRYRFAFPPISEQLKIAAFLDIETTKLDTLTSEAERAIELLKERRSALIAAAVTGKLDVRDAVPEKIAA